jgi:molybdopterin molybdotransferase
MAEFLILKSAEDARALLAAVPPVEAEMVALDEADGRVLAADVVAPEDLPPWPRATMDGYAVRARDSFGASEAVPAFLTARGAVPMGEVLGHAIGPGETAAIATGGVLPDGCDAVVMVEYTQAAGDEIEVRRGVAAGENVMRPGDDLRRGERVLAAGRRLRPQDVGALAALGVVRVGVFRRPRVGIVATGNEVVAPDAVPRPGQVRDVNSLALAAAARRAGAAVELAGIVRDDAAALTAGIADLARRCDAVLLSGGSSIGARDLTAIALDAAGAEVVFHGISVRPGKPTIFARIGGKPVLGMPGVPVSAMVIFDVFVRPMFWRLGGEAPGRDPWPARRRARLRRRAPSVAGREDYLRVRLVAPDADGRPWAEPVLGGSAALGTLVRADGLVIVPAASEGVAEGDEVEVLMWS